MLINKSSNTKALGGDMNEQRLNSYILRSRFPFEKKGLLLIYTTNTNNITSDLKLIPYPLIMLIGELKLSVLHNILLFLNLSRLLPVTFTNLVLYYWQNGTDSVK